MTLGEGDITPVVYQNLPEVIFQAPIFFYILKFGKVTIHPASSSYVTHG